MLRLLDVGSSRIGKVFKLRLRRGVLSQFIKLLLPVSAIAFLFWNLWRRWDEPIYSIHGSGLFLAFTVFIILIITIGLLWKLNRLEQAGISLFLYSLGSMFMRVHLFVWDKVFLRWGSLDYINRIKNR
jgi:hypothetical protein